MDGILVIDKPAGITSHDVVARVRSIFKTKRVGHTGTLDPFATGVLVLLIGKATKLAQFLDKDIKEYESVVRFGYETDTGDVTGSRIAECGMPNEELISQLANTDWETLLNNFQGKIEQTPPMFSAKKVAGKKLYELARKGIEIPRKSLQINIYEIELLKISRISNPASAIRLRIVCSAGTYIRTLTEDIGRKIGTGAHLEQLKRRRAGKFDLSDCFTIDALENLDQPESALQPLSKAVDHLPSIRLTDDRIAKTKNGLSTRLDNAELADGEFVRLHAESGELIAIGFYYENERSVQPKIVLL